MLKSYLSGVLESDNWASSAGSARYARNQDAAYFCMLLARPLDSGEAKILTSVPDPR